MSPEDAARGACALHREACPEQVGGNADQGWVAWAACSAPWMLPVLPGPGWCPAWAGLGGGGSSGPRRSQNMGQELCWESPRLL